MRDEYDCLVVGGGPAGCTTAALVAQAGHSTLLVEREKLPRYHVGESLMPETYWTLQRLGVLEKLRSSNFVKKFSVAFLSHTGLESSRFIFKEHDPRECSQTWQVERAGFDKMLFDNAAEKGADCSDETHVLDVRFDGDRAVGAKVQKQGGEPREVRARVVVDATGQQTLLANRLGLKVERPDLKKVAIWGYYRNAARDPGEHGGGTLFLHTSEKKSWFWYIPLQDGITSIGVVGDRDYLLNDRGMPEDIFEDELVKCPVLADRLMNAELTSEFQVAKEFSYLTTEYAGDGWVLVGDASGFIDPIYSSGVYFAMTSGELAADAIIDALKSGDTSAKQLGRWVDDFQAGTKWIQKLVDAYYANESSFDRFLKAHPEHRGNLTDLLIGRIFYDGAGNIFEDLGRELQDATLAALEPEM